MTSDPDGPNDEEALDNVDPVEIEPYEFLAEDIPAAADVVDAAFSVGLDGWAVETALVEQAAAKTMQPLSASLLEQLRLAARYPLDIEFRGRAGCELQTTTEDDYPWWVPLSRVGDDTLHLWADLAKVVTTPAAKARLHDLLFNRRHGDVVTHLRTAVSAYLETLSSEPTPLELKDTYAVLRAWTMTRRSGEALRNDDVREVLATLCARVLGETPGQHPGILMPMLNALHEGPARRKGATSYETVAVNALLARAAKQYKSPHLATELAGYRRRIAKNQEDIDSINRDEVDAYFRTAEASPHPAQKLHWFEKASRVAAKRGLNDLASLAASRMQRIRPEDLNLTRLESSSTIEPRYVDGMLRPYTRGSTWRDGLRHFVVSDVPTGTIEWLHQVRADDPSVLRHLFPSVILTGEGMPRATASSDEAKDADAMSLPARIAAENYGLMMHRGLSRMIQKYGVPDASELVDFFVTELHCEPRLARSITRAFLHYWNGDSESAVHVAVPKIEGTARNLLRELDQGIYQVQAGNSPGGYPYLHTLIKELEDLGLEESWAYFLRWLLLGPYGVNLRNEVAHGFVYALDPRYTVLILRALCLVALMTSGDVGSLDEEKDWARRRQSVTEAIRQPFGSPDLLEKVLTSAATTCDRLARGFRRGSSWARRRRTSGK